MISGGNLTFKLWYQEVLLPIYYDLKRWSYLYIMISGGNLTYRLWSQEVILHMISGGNPTYTLMSGGKYLPIWLWIPGGNPKLYIMISGGDLSG